MPNTPTPKPGPYPGRTELDTANARFRRAVSRLHREAARHDPQLLPTLTSIVSEAAEHLQRLASDAEAAENCSARHKAALAAAEEKVRRTRHKGVRAGNPRAADLLARLDDRRSRRSTGPSDDAA